MSVTKQSWPDTESLLRLDDQVAVVTGAGAGLGRAIACMLASAGAAVVVVDMDGAAAEATAGFIGDNGARALPVAADVTDFPSTERVILTTIEHFGQLDILVNNAGIYPTGEPLPQLDSGVFERTFRVNVYGTYQYMSEAVKNMRPGGRIINVSSIVSQRPPGPGVAHYASSKAAINALTRSGAVDFAPLGVRVNALLPGMIPTEGTLGMAGSFELFAGRTPSGRIGQPEDVARVALFLASPASVFVNGQCLAVDGGFSATG